MNNKKNTFIAWGFLYLLIVGYLHYFPIFTPSPKVKDKKEEKGTIISSLTKELIPTSTSEEDCLTLENNFMQVTLSQQGGQVKKVVLKKYKNYDGTPLVIVNEASSIDMALPTAKGILHSNKCYFKRDNKDTLPIQIKLIHEVDGDPERYIQHTFSLKENSYQLECKVETQGIEIDPSQKATLLWYQALRSLEKDPKTSRQEITSYYCEADRKKVSYLSTKNQKEKVESLEKPIKWITSTQKFFTTAITADKPFPSVKRISNPITKEKEPTLLQEIALTLTINPISLSQGETHLSFYFGPNEYHLLKKFAPQFEANRYLGFTPIKQLNQYFTLPFSEYIERHLGHPLLALLILILILTLLQLPFTYQSHLLEIRKKALDPMVEALKLKYKDNPTQAQIEETQLRNKAGLFSLQSILPILLQAPIWPAMIIFMRYNPHFRQVPFLWIKDLSTYDSLIQLPFSIPFLGSHISIIALIASILMIIPSFLSNRKKIQTSQEKTIQYILPFFLFFLFNSYSVIFHLYRIISQFIGFIPKLFFKQFVNEAPIQKAFLVSLEEKKNVSKLSRSHMRLQKRTKKTK